jgi:hypothetical protein
MDWFDNMTASIVKADDEMSLKELVAMADKSFWIFRQNARQPQLADFPSLALYRHLIHMANGIELLLSARATRPAIPLLRSAFEAYLSLEYIFQERYEERSLAWMCSYYRRLLRRLDLLDPTTKTGLNLQEEFRNLFPNESHKDLPYAVSASSDFTWIKERLNSPPLNRINGEYDKLKKKDWEPPWYSLDDPAKGRTGLKRLSKRVNLAPLYLVYYEPWSEIIHANEFDGLLSALPNGTVDFDPLESSINVEDPTIELGVDVFLTRSTPLMAKKFVFRT